MKINTNLTFKIIIVASLAIVSILFLLNQKDNFTKETQEEKYQILTLNIDPNYFDDSEIWGGSKPDGRWTSATIREGYRSEPTTNISLKEDRYDQEVLDLNPVKNNNEIYIHDIGVDTFTDQIKEYGDLARRFLPDDLIHSIEKFDVDGDSVDEQIIATCSWGGNGCPHFTYVVKNNKIIFSTGAREIIKTENGNGFTLAWQKEYKDPYGEMRTRFVFEDGKFKPIYEQEIKYFNVK